MYTRFPSTTFHGLVLASGVLIGGNCLAEPFSYDQEALPGAKPWTSAEFQNDPAEFQFVVIGDRTGGANVQETFKLAVGQLNLLQPEFVINVGDIIEGYSDDKAELNAEWDEVDAMLNQLNMPFFRTVGNHDIANEVAKEVWLERHGDTRYAFVYKDTLFVVLDSEDPPRTPPEGIKEKLDEYNRLQTEDPAKAQAMLAEFMADESVVAGLGKPVDFSDEQIAWLEDTLAKHPDVRWTFLFLHDPVWENPSESFKAIQATAQGAPAHVPCGAPALLRLRQHRRRRAHHHGTGRRLVPRGRPRQRGSHHVGDHDRRRPRDRQHRAEGRVRPQGTGSLAVRRL